MIARIACLALLAATLAGCAQTEQQRIAENACRAQADEVDNRLNRADMAQPDTSTNPFATSGMPGIHTQPLQEQDAHDRRVKDCLNDTSGTLPDK